MDMLTLISVVHRGCESRYFMSDKRRGDTKSQTRFRSRRLFKDGGQWYFLTREGTMEGPFERRSEAEDRLEQYVSIMRSGFMPSESELKIEPLD